MPAIMIRCPVHNKDVTTGLDTETIIFETLPNLAIPMRCIACGQSHEWKPRDAWVANAKQPCRT